MGLFLKVRGPVRKIRRDEVKMLKNLDRLDVRGKKVLVRCDFNVPLKDGKITDDTRITEALPTIEELLSKNAAVILISHLGRPGGEVKSQFSLAPVAERLDQILDEKVDFCGEAAGEMAKRMAEQLQPGSVLVLENLRFYPGEKNNDENFSRALASFADVFVQEAFGTVHRQHASMTGIPALLESAAGRLLEKEIKYLSMALDPQKPLVVCLGGAKIETKLGLIENMLDRADSILIGGAMAYTLLKETGAQIGNSLYDENEKSTAENIINKIKDSKCEMLLPVDHIATDSIDNPEKIEKTSDVNIPSGLAGVDIGQKTAKIFEDRILNAKTVVLNGPMGIFEQKKFSRGTKAVFNAVAKATQKGAVTILGGGDTVSAVNAFKFGKKDFSHVSTGGGASLKFLEGGKLPGIEALKERA